VRGASPIEGGPWGFSGTRRRRELRIVVHEINEIKKKISQKGGNRMKKM